MPHLLATNDFPPKVGGIQNYLWELWRRLPPDEFAVFTTRYRDTELWDSQQAYPIVRSSHQVFLPYPGMARAIDRVASDHNAELVVLDPALPIGLVGKQLSLPYGVVLHGAEITVPGRLPIASGLLGRVLEGASLLIAAGGYPLDEARRALGKRDMPPTVMVPPGVDTTRFTPLDPSQRTAARQQFGLPPDALVITSVSRLVPRKGMDVLVEASLSVKKDFPDLVVAIAGSGRDKARLEDLVQRTHAPVQLLGRVSDDDLPAFLGCGDVFAMLCRNRWMGLEQEGFGIVFLEAAACGVAQVAGRSGGAHEAVAHGETGLVVDNPGDVEEVASALRKLLGDDDGRKEMGAAARVRAQKEFEYSVLSERLHEALAHRPT
jgi:phosphatidylinositol alpha-1,6-mannosyltransferase